ncbi:MAG: discoidin domain-containing protein, partial [Planctomycetota bacterium]|nr:discoidin domain-containing protein [Planctomycetota bacterium]
MKRLWLSLILIPVCLVQGEKESVNLLLRNSGGMATALASAANLNFSAQKACDGKPGTGWVSEKGSLPVWLRVEWRAAVEVQEVVFRHFPDCPFKDAGAVGNYAIEVLSGGEWKEVAGGDASKVPLDREIRHELKEPAKTRAVRLLIKSAPSGQVAISEFRVMGPETVLPIEWSPHWQARWIWSEPSLYIPHREPLRRYLRRSFSLDDPDQVAEVWLLA